MNIGLRIKELRNLKGITAEQLADGAGFTRIYITKLENNPDAAPSFSALEKICNFLGYTLEEFFSLDLAPELKQLIDTAKGLSSNELKTLIDFLEQVTTTKKILNGNKIEYAQESGGRKLTEEEELAISEYFKNKK